MNPRQPPVELTKNNVTIASYNVDRTPFFSILKACLVVLPLFLCRNSQGQKITVDYQLKMLEMNLNNFSYTLNPLLRITPFTTKFNHKSFLNDTIKNPINTDEITILSIEEKSIILSNNRGKFLFQIKNKFLKENKNGLIEHYYCVKSNKLYLIIIVENGIYIRKDNSYYSSFYYSKES